MRQKEAVALSRTAAAHLIAQFRCKANCSVPIGRLVGRLLSANSSGAVCRRTPALWRHWQSIYSTLAVQTDSRRGQIFIGKFENYFKSLIN